jgi:predicted O-methyltransferase YrrM
MSFESVSAVIKGIPHITPERGRILYDFIRREKPDRCLELGFSHGTSACYIAAALADNGRGHLTTVDLLHTAAYETAIEHLLSRTGLESWVTPVREHTSYNWFLKKELERSIVNGVYEPIYDFCFIDGPKNWQVDGFAFLLVDRLLRPGGWVLFDDYDWTYASTGRQQTDGINHRDLGPDELDQPHIEAVVRLLVMQHPDYSEVRVQDGIWAWARKSPTTKTRRIVYEKSYTYKALVARLLTASVRKLRLGRLDGL